MLQTLNPIDLFRRSPSKPAPTPDPVNEYAWAVSTLKAVGIITAELAKLDAEKAADDTLLAEIESRQLRRGERRRVIDRLRLDESRATNIITGATEPSAEENRSHDLGLQKQQLSSELQMRYRDFRVNCEPVESTEDHKQLQSILTGIADCEATIRRENDNPQRQQGLSGAEHRLRRLQVEQVDVQAKVDRYRHEYQRWSEIQAAKQEAANAFAKRDELRAEREAAALAAAHKSK